MFGRLCGVSSPGGQGSRQGARIRNPRGPVRSLCGGGDETLPYDSADLRLSIGRFCVLASCAAHRSWVGLFLREDGGG